MSVSFERIEAISVLFSGGVAAGTLLIGSAGPPYLPCSLLCLALAALLALRQPLPAALLCGMLCAWTASLAVPATEPTLPGRLAAGAVGRLRARIDGLPFASAGTAPLLKALLTGDRSGLDSGTVRAFRESGASHLLALSGLHIGILYLLLDRLTWIFGRAPVVRRIRSAGTVLLAGAYTLMTGASPSIVRAFLFITLHELHQLLGRQQNAVRILCLALLIQLALDPRVIRSVGFQLSYLAMAGIFLLYPVLRRWYPGGRRYDPLRKIWDTAALSISCQAFTAPLAWHYFHTFPRYFLLTNLLAIPLTTLVMAGGIFSMATGMACPLTDRLCRALVWVLETISAL